jgi:glycosyltransferase involved in cell wall biosynthesis
MEQDRSGFPSVSVVIVAKDSEEIIGRAAKSARWAEELLVVVDSSTTDRTAEIAREAGALVRMRPWEGFAKTKQWAVDQASSDWVFLLDADEVISEALAVEIRQVLMGIPDTVNGLSCPRKNYFLGKWMRHGGWYPDRVMRFFRKPYGSFTQVRVHESIRIYGDSGRFQQPLEHFTDEMLTGYLDKLNRYTSLGAEDLAERGRRCRWWDLWLRPLWMFLKMGVFRLGFLDGWRGMLLAVLSSVHVLVKYAKLRSMVIKRQGEDVGT